jgi:hypothetical protein
MKLPNRPIKVECAALEAANASSEPDSVWNRWRTHRSKGIAEH